MLLTLFFYTYAAAQSTGNNTTNLDSSRCPLTIGTLSPDDSFNTTGTQPFQWPGEEQRWYLTLTLNDTRSELLSSQLHDLQGYLSIPNDIKGSACVYMLPGFDINKDDGNEERGCAGVVSDGCIQSIQRKLGSTAKRLSVDTCRPYWDDADVRNGECEEIADFGNPFMTIRPIEFENKTCTASRPPSRSMPEDYLTYPAMGIGMAPGQSDQDFRNTTWYSRYVRQSRPFVIMRLSPFWEGSLIQVRVVCVAPRFQDENGTEANVDWTQRNEFSKTRASLLWVSTIVGVVGAFLAFL